MTPRGYTLNTSVGHTTATTQGYYRLQMTHCKMSRKTNKSPEN